MTSENCQWSLDNVLKDGEDEQAMNILYDYLVEMSDNTQQPKAKRDFYVRTRCVLERLRDVHDTMHGRIHQLEAENEELLQLNRDMAKVMQGSGGGGKLRLVKS